MQTQRTRTQPVRIRHRYAQRATRIIDDMYVDGVRESEPLGVGFIGAGLAAQTIHLPTLARMRNLFQVVAVTDIDDRASASVAMRTGARIAESADDVIADPNVQVIVICSPHEFHAEQVIAACQAAKTAVLCEKPLAVSVEESQQIAIASRAHRVPVLVGAMHMHDPAWSTASRRWLAEGHDPKLIRSSIMIPYNARYEEAATELTAASTPPPQRRLNKLPNGEQVWRGVMGLGIHDLPLIRRLLATPEPHVLSAFTLQPFGYVLLAECGETLVELSAQISGVSEPDWNLEVVASTAALTLRFPPSYVHAGSAHATIAADADTWSVGPYPSNGYEAEWRALAEVAAGVRGFPDPAELIDDVEFALDIATQARHLAEAGA